MMIFSYERENYFLNNLHSHVSKFLDLGKVPLCLNPLLLDFYWPWIPKAIYHLYSFEPKAF